MIKTFLAQQLNKHLTMDSQFALFLFHQIAKRIKHTTKKTSIRFATERGQSVYNDGGNLLKSFSPIIWSILILIIYSFTKIKSSVSLNKEVSHYTDGGRIGIIDPKILSKSE